MTVRYKQKGNVIVMRTTGRLLFGGLWYEDARWVVTADVLEMLRSEDPGVTFEADAAK